VLLGQIARQSFLAAPDRLHDRCIVIRLIEKHCPARRSSRQGFTGGRGVKAQVLQNLLDDLCILDAGNDPHRTGAVLALPDLDPKDALQSLRPTHARWPGCCATLPPLRTVN
jgi:hypothetical protein